MLAQGRRGCGSREASKEGGEVVRSWVGLPRGGGHNLKSRNLAEASQDKMEGKTFWAKGASMCKSLEFSPLIK